MIEKYALFKVFAHLRNTREKESVRSLARKAKIGVSTAKHCLDYLFEKDIVKKQVFGRMYQFEINNENILARQFKITMTVAELEDSGLVKELLQEYPSILSIVLFGSAASGRDSSASDIDILIIASKEIKIIPLKAEKRLKREVSIIKYAYTGWKRKARNDKVFYEKIITEGIALYGELPIVV